MCALQWEEINAYAYASEVAGESLSDAFLRINYEGKVLYILSSKPDPDPKLNPKPDPDPKIIISDPQHCYCQTIYEENSAGTVLKFSVSLTTIYRGASTC